MIITVCSDPPTILLNFRKSVRADDDQNMCVMKMMVLLATATVIESYRANPLFSKLRY